MAIFVQEEKQQPVYYVCLDTKENKEAAEGDKKAGAGRAEQCIDLIFLLLLSLHESAAAATANNNTWRKEKKRNEGKEGESLWRGRCVCFGTPL